MYGERMRKLRKEHKVPEKKLAELMGVKIRGYQFYESETTEPTINALIALADFYDVTIDYLVGPRVRLRQPFGRTMCAPTGGLRGKKGSARPQCGRI